MAETSFGFDDVAGDRVYSAAQFMEWMSAQNGDLSGVIAGIGNNLAVTSLGGYQTSTNTGACVKGGYTYRNSAAVVKTHDAVTSGLKRYDVIVVRRDEVTTRTFLITVIKGTEGASPSIPSIGSGDVNLATLYIDNTSGTPAYTVTDNRVYVGQKSVTITAATTFPAFSGNTKLIFNPGGAIAVDISAGGGYSGLELTLDNISTYDITVTTLSGGTFVLNKGIVKLSWNGSAWELISNGGSITRVQFNSGTGATWKMPFTGRIQAFIVGGGGAGGGTSVTGTTRAAAGGGGSGQILVYKAKQIAGNTNTYTIGTGGTGGTGLGGSGNNTTFNDGSTTYTALGGSGGAAGSTPSGGVTSYIGGLGGAGGGAGGNGATASAAAVNLPGPSYSGGTSLATISVNVAQAGAQGAGHSQFNSSGGAGGTAASPNAGGGGGGGGFEVNGGAGGNANAAGAGGSGTAATGGGAGGGGGGIGSTGTSTGGAGGAGTIVIEFI